MQTLILKSNNNTRPRIAPEWGEEKITHPKTSRGDGYVHYCDCHGGVCSQHVSGGTVPKANTFIPEDEKSRESRPTAGTVI